jgi:exodeoxyribonuclease VII small subunit
MTETTAMGTPGFEAALDRLAEIVARIEGEPLELDESLALFEEGVRLLRGAGATLGEAEARIRRLVEEADGTIRLVDGPAEP